MEIVRTANPPKTTGRRPKESDSGPPETPVNAQPAKVAVANWPAAATDISRSVAISTSSGGIIRITLMLAKTVQ